MLIRRVSKDRLIFHTSIECGKLVTSVIRYRSTGNIRPIQYSIMIDDIERDIYE